MEHGCHQVQECEAPRPAFLFIQEELTERRHAAFQIHTHIQTVDTGSHTVTHLRATQRKPRSIRVRMDVSTAV